jgi:hypothetical protein
MSVACLSAVVSEALGSSVEMGMAAMAVLAERTETAVSMVRVFLREACLSEMAAQKVMVASTVSAVLAASEMVWGASKRGEKVVIPLPPPRPSAAEPHTVVSPPF